MYIPDTTPLRYGTRANICVQLLGHTFNFYDARQLQSNASRKCVRILVAIRTIGITHSEEMRTSSNGDEKP